MYASGSLIAAIILGLGVLSTSSHSSRASQGIFKAVPRFAGQCYGVVSERWDRVEEEDVLSGRLCLVDGDILSQCTSSSCLAKLVD